MFIIEPIFPEFNPFPILILCFLKQLVQISAYAIADILLSRVSGKTMILLSTRPQDFYAHPRPCMPDMNNAQTNHPSVIWLRSAKLYNVSADYLSNTAPDPKRAQKKARI